ncbi:hypothetical protein BH09ACT12_BH09ACT12_37640 [soil metagenome]
MSRHRAEPPPQYRPRYGRMAVLGVSLTTTAVGLLGGLGVFPSAADDQGLTASNAAAEIARDPAGRTDAQRVADPAPESEATPPSESTESATEGPTEGPVVVESDPAAPASSGEGRRVVFSESDQRVWLIDDDEEVQRT